MAPWLGALDALELFLDFRNAAIGELAGALILTLALRIGELDPQLIELGLELLCVGQLFLLGLPARRDVGRLLLERGQLAFQVLQALLRARVMLLPERLLLDFQAHDLTVDRIELLRLGIDLHLEACSRLVDEVDGLVREEAIGDVAVRKRRRRHQGGIGDAHAMVLLVLVLEPAQDRNCILHARLVDIDRLEAARERCVLLHMLLVFVERGRADAMQIAARQRRLEQVGRIHGAVRLAGADERVHLVDEQDDAAGGGRHLLQHRLEPLLELAAILCPRDQCAHVECKQLLVLQALGHVAVDDALSKTLDDGGLADAGLPDQHRIVLGATGKHLHGAAYFLVAADHWVDLALAGGLGEVAGSIS